MSLIIYFLLQSELVIPDVIRSVNLTRWLQTCDDFRLDVMVKINGYSLKAQEEIESGNRLMCPPGGAKMLIPVT